MKRLPVAAFLALSCLVLAACSTGPARRVSEPAASIQQLTVQADGNWSVALRIDNFSSVPMRFDAVELAITVNGVAAGTLRGNAGITIGPESGDVATLALSPGAAAKVHVADALVSRRSVGYALAGHVDATPRDGRQRSYEIERESAMTPVPGLPGVLR